MESLRDANLCWIPACAGMTSHVLRTVENLIQFLMRYGLLAFALPGLLIAQHNRCRCATLFIAGSGALAGMILKRCARIFRKVLRLRSE